MRNRLTIARRPRRLSRHLTGRDNDVYSAFEGREVLVSHLNGEWDTYAKSADTDAARGAILQTTAEDMIEGDHLVYGPGTFEIAQAGDVAGVGISLPSEVTGLRFSGCGIGVSTLYTNVANLELLHIDCEGGYVSDFTATCGALAREPILFQNATTNTMERIASNHGGVIEHAIWLNGSTAVAIVNDCTLDGTIYMGAGGNLTISNSNGSYDGDDLSSTASYIESGTVVTTLLATNCTFDISGIDEECDVDLVSMFTANGTVHEYVNCTIIGSPNAAGDGLTNVSSTGTLNTIRVRGGTITAGRYSLNQSGTKTTIEVDSEAVYGTTNGVITAI